MAPGNDGNVGTGETPINGLSSSAEMRSPECEVCTEHFDEGNHLPRCLTCGHTLCTSCIKNILEQSPILKCPFCRKQHRIPVSTPGELPVNYSIMRVVGCRRMSGETSQENLDDWFVWTKHDIGKSSETLCGDLENELNTLRRLQKRLESKEQGHARLFERIQEYINYVKKVGVDISKEKSDTKKAIEEGSAKWDKLKESREKLESSKTLVEMSEAHQLIVACHSDIQKWRVGTRHLHHSDVFKSYRDVKRVTAEALALVPVKQKESVVKERMVGSHFLLYIIVFVVGILAIFGKGREK